MMWEAINGPGRPQSRHAAGLAEAAVALTNPLRGEHRPDAQQSPGFCGHSQSSQRAAVVTSATWHGRALLNRTPAVLTSGEQKRPVQFCAAGPPLSIGS